jgi:elongator complex protein 1
MAFQTILLEHKAIDVAISKSGNRLAILSNSDLAMYALDLEKRPIPKPVLLWRTDAIKNHCPRHVAFVGDTEVFCLTDNWDDDESSLWKAENEALACMGPFIDTEGVSSLVSDVDYQMLCLQSQIGTLHSIDTTGEASGLPPQTSTLCKLPNHAPEIKIVVFEDNVCSRA